VQDWKENFQQTGCSAADWTEPKDRLESRIPDSENSDAAKPLRAADNLAPSVIEKTEWIFTLAPDSGCGRRQRQGELFLSCERHQGFKR
jgi:hypothetical protein